MSLLKQKNLQYKKVKYTSGFTLIEALVAIFIFSLALVSLITITSRGITGVAQARDQATAQFLAQEGIELMRNVRDTNFLGVIEGNGAAWNDNMTQCNAIPASDWCFVDYNGFSTELDSGGTSTLGLTLEEVTSNPPYDVYEAQTTAESRFTRKVYYEPAMNTDEIIVHSVVRWSNGTIPREVHLTASLMKWIQLLP